MKEISVSGPTFLVSVTAVLESVNHEPTQLDYENSGRGIFAKKPASGLCTLDWIQLVRMSSTFPCRHELLINRL